MFQQVAQTASFSRAAELLRLDKSKISRDVRALETALSVPLFARSTRAVRLTPEGVALLARLGPLLTGIDETLEAFSDRPAGPSGVTRITTTAEIGREILGPALVPFRARFPAVRVEVVITSHIVDFVKEGIDLALRVGRPNGEALVARKIADLEAGFFAAPTYLSQRGTPLRLEQLAEHDGLWPLVPKGQRSFGGEGAPPPAVACADFSVLAAIARTGGGIALLPTLLAARDVQAGALVRVLPAVSLQEAPLFLVSQSVRSLPPRVAVLRTYLLEKLAKHTLLQ